MQVDVTDPVGAPVRTEVLRSPMGEDKITFLPARAGPHRVDVRIGGVRVPGMPSPILYLFLWKKSQISSQLLNENTCFRPLRKSDFESNNIMYSAGFPRTVDVDEDGEARAPRVVLADLENG